MIQPIDNVFSFIGSAAEPTVVEIYASQKSPVAVFMAKNGDGLIPPAHRVDQFSRSLVGRCGNDPTAAGLQCGQITPLHGHNKSFWQNMRGVVGVELRKQITPVFGLGVEGEWTVNTSTWNGAMRMSMTFTTAPSESESIATGVRMTPKAAGPPGCMAYIVAAALFAVRFTYRGDEERADSLLSLLSAPEYLAGDIRSSLLPVPDSVPSLAAVVAAGDTLAALSEH